MEKTYFIKTFGCQQNKRDSELIAYYYKAQRLKPAKKIQEADIIVINTCSVRQSAEDRVYGLVNNPKSQIPNPKSQRRSSKTKKLKIILTGCMVGLYGKYFLSRKMPNVDEFRKIDEWKLVNKPSETGLINIMTGCNNFCSYCVVPYARGREKSRPIEEILSEVKALINMGVKEITLLGQNVNSYGKDLYKNIDSCIRVLIREKNGGVFESLSREKILSLGKKFKTPFAFLLAILNEIPEIKKIKFLTSNPWDLNDDIIEAMTLPKIDRYLHLPVQSGDDEILKKMNRKYTARQYLDLIKKIRQKIPDIEIGTDIIVGFPGETEKQFQNTFSLCKKANFVKAYIAMYSPRPKTAAYKLRDNIPYKVKKARWCLLENLINKKK